LEKLQKRDKNKFIKKKNFFINLFFIQNSPKNPQILRKIKKLIKAQKAPQKFYLKNQDPDKKNYLIFIKIPKKIRKKSKKKSNQIKSLSISIN
jgi:hypothetical protein